MIAGLHTSRFVGLLGASTESVWRASRPVDEAVRPWAKGDGALDDGARMATAENKFRANAAGSQTANRLVGTILDALA